MPCSLYLGMVMVIFLPQSKNANPLVKAVMDCRSGVEYWVSDYKTFLSMRMIFVLKILQFDWLSLNRTAQSQPIKLLTFENEIGVHFQESFIFMGPGLQY